MKDTKRSLHFRTKVVDGKNPSDEREAGPLVSLRIRNGMHVGNTHGKRTMSTRILTGANEVGGHDRGKHYLLSTYYSSTL